MTKNDQRLIWEAYSDDPQEWIPPTGPGWTDDGGYDPYLEEAIKIADGLHIEVEHANPDIAQKIKSIPKEVLVNMINIVLDHINEDRDYYEKLQKANL